MMESTHRKNTVATMVLLAAAVVFGMILAAGTGLTPPAASGPLQLQGSAPAAASLSTPLGLPSFADLAEAVQPAVVSIHAISFERRRRPEVNPFEFFFGPRRRPSPRQEDDDEERRSDSGGSGFIVSADGLVVTNNHVIDGATDLRVTVGGREFSAIVKGTDPDTDIALLQIDADKTFNYLSLGDSESLRVGDWVMAIGSPLSLNSTVTVGVVSAKGRSIGLANVSFENFIQTDAAINFGNSGGPLVNLQGKVVGIATAINYGAENIGFAVPVSTLQQILPQLRETGRVERGYLGVAIENLTFLSAQSFGLEEPRGALVTDVTEDTPAETAGLKNGDVILKVDAVEVTKTRDLIEYVASRGPGARVKLKVLRGGKTIEKAVKLAQRPGNGQDAAPQSKDEDPGIDWLGIDYRELTPALRQQHGLPDEVEGVWITSVSQASPLFEQGVQPGLVITEVNGQATPDRESFEGAVRAASSDSVLRLYLRAIGPQGSSRGTYAFVQVP